MVKNGDMPAEEDPHFQGMDVHEQFQFYFRQHWIRLLQPLVCTIFWSMVIALGYWLVFVELGVSEWQNRHGILIALFSIFAIIHITFLMRFYTYFLYLVVITDRRVHRIKKTLFSIDDHQIIDLATFQDIHKWQHGIVQNLFGFGSLIMEAQETVLKIHFVPHIAKIYARLSHLRERARERMNTSQGMVRKA